jgi:polar amino acid transport system substrate-binding protein
VLPDDNVSATIEFADGSVGTILYSALGADSLTKERIEIMGDGRSVVIDNFRRIELYRGSVREVVSCNMDKGHRRQFAELVSAVSRAAPSPIPIKDLLYSTLATFCIGESLRSGKPVQVEIDEALAVRGSLT